MPKYSEKDLVSLIEKGANDFLAQGITTSTDAGVGLSLGISEYNAHIKAVAEDRNPLRMRFMILHHLLRQDGPFTGYSVEQLDEEIHKKTDGKARLDSAKLFQDGSIQGYTAALRQPYSSRENYSGDLAHDQTAFNEEVADLHARGFRIAIHGNGDLAIESNINALAYALEKSPRDDHRHRIEHVQTAATVDLDRMRDYGIEASFFINHVYYWGERHRSIFLGEDRARRINPLKDALNRGFQFTLHSDCPVTPISPLFSIWAAVNRLTTGGNVLGEEQKIDVLTALKAMTIFGAYLNFEEDITGTIEVGKRADFAVLDTDPTTCSHIDIKDITVVSTFIGGKKVYEKNLVLN
jgi:predicted amidohydrolase YtcJ